MNEIINTTVKLSEVSVSVFYGLRFSLQNQNKKNKISKHLISFISFHPIFALDNTLVFLHIIIMSPPPPRGRFGTIYGKMLIGQLLFFVIGAFCINQLTVGRGQQKLRKAMEISSKTSSKGRKSWMRILMVRNLTLCQRVCRNKLWWLNCLGDIFTPKTLKALSSPK